MVSEEKVKWAKENEENTNKLLNKQCFLFVVNRKVCLID